MRDGSITARRVVAFAHETPWKRYEPFPRRPARGDFDEKGNFTLTTFDSGDGIIPGRYSVNVTCWREKPTLETRQSANYVPPNFEHEVTIAADADEPVEIAINVPVIQQ